MPCAAAYSMVRALSSKWAGPLYQVRNHSSSMNQGTGGSTMDVTQTPDGYADTSVQDTFCSGTTCTVSILYDQSGNGNDLKSAPSGPAGNGQSGTADYESSATKLSVTAGGHKVYALYMNAVEGYRTGLNVKGKNMPGMNQDEGIYELADGTHYGTQCCWDFGNVTTNPAQYHTMNTIFFGTGFWGKGASGGAKAGPWFEADFEGGVWAGGASAGDPGGSSGAVANTMDPALPVDFAFATLKTSKPSSCNWALRVANAATATDLTTAYSGKAPVTNWDNPGGILLGVGGDNSNNSYGTFFEGAIVAGLPADATDLAVLKNVQGVGYKK
jgi:non-reducing end alpha-L-arabinofuranosidase